VAGYVPGGESGGRETGPGARGVTLDRADVEALLKELPAGPFVSVFVTHEILDPEAFASFQPRSDRSP
jgi:hypothetical protein